MNPDGSHSPPAHASHAPAAIARLPGIPSLELGMATDPGRDPNKQVNEDAMLARDTPHGFLAVVCDGMGGHVGGREASHLAIDTIFRVFDATPAGVSPQQILRDALTQANGAVYARGLQAPELKGMGSTCVAILTHPGGTDVAHVGDSRVYLLTHQQVYQVTKDHSLVQRLIDANMLTPEQAANHPNANQITNAFGQRPDIEVEIRPQPFPHTPGDVFVLCSDGLSDEVGPQDILQVLAPYGPLDHAARQLIDLANARGGHDNITVVLVRFPGGAPFAVAATGSASTPTAALSTAPATTTAEMEIIQPVAPPASAAPLPMSAPAPVPPTPPPAFAPPPAYVPSSAELPVAEKRRGGGVIVAIILIVLLVAGGVAAFVFLGVGSDKPQPAASTSVDDDETTPPPASTKSVKPKPVQTSDDLPPVNIIPHPSQHPQPQGPKPTGKPTGEPTTKPTGEPTVKQ